MLTLSRSLSLAAAVLSLASVAAAHQIVYTASLSGPAEAPPNASPGVGFSTVTIDLDAVTMRVQLDFSGLLGNVTASHIHGLTALPFEGTAGVMTPVPTFPGFPLGGTSGSYDQTFDLTLASSYNPAFVTASGGTVGQALNVLLQSFDESRGYLNIHTNLFPAGEIRGFYTEVPAPGAAGVLVLAGLFASRRRR